MTEVPSNPKVAEALKLFGKVISDEARKAGGFVSPLLAAFTARMVSLEQPQFDFVAGLDPDQESVMLELVLERISRKDDPLMEAIKMQVTFESLYATELQSLRQEQMVKDSENASKLDRIAKVGSNIQSNSQVANLYREIFRLMLSNGNYQSRLSFELSIFQPCRVVFLQVAWTRVFKTETWRGR